MNYSFFIESYKKFRLYEIHRGIRIIASDYIKPTGELVKSVPIISNPQGN